MQRWLVSLLVGFALAPTALAWEIASFETHVRINEDATATITETIVADFGQESRHGIYRDIPIHYTDRAGQHFRLRLRILDVTDQSGRGWPYRLESAGRYRRIRIGDARRIVRGLVTYRIVYEVQRGAVRFLPDHDECYWNLTGNEWAVPMRLVRAGIELPPSVRDVRAVAYVGGYGSTQQLSAISVREGHVVLEPTQAFGPYEGLTAAVGWAKGALHPPRAWRIIGWWLEDNWVYGLPLLVFIGMMWLWNERGRDPRFGRSRMVEYEVPDELTPAEMGTLMDQRADLRDMTSTVIDLAVRGYLRIEPRKSSMLGMARARDYRLVSLKPWAADARLKPHERSILSGIFKKPNAAKDMSDLEHRFYENLPDIRNNLYAGLVKAGYLDSDPESVRFLYLILGVLVGVGVWLVLLWLQPRQQLAPVSLIIASALCGLVVIAFSRIMPRRTLKGARTTDRIFGFLEFLRQADADRVRRINDPNLFERCLPYALAFGVANQWASAFEGLYTQPPSWYAGNWDVFSARQLGWDIERATSSMGRSFVSGPRASGGSSGSWGGSGFGGGGFSGGGGGGGGGGAW